MQITTVHQSKGLQYPVVHLPFVAMNYVRTVEVARYHDGSGTRMLDVSGGGATWGAHAEAHLHEEAGEELRDLYVALTRAQSQVVTWWAPTANTQHGGLHRILFGRQPGQPDVPDQQDVRDDDYAARVLEMLGELGGPQPEVSEIAAEEPEAQTSAPGRMAARVFGREVDTEWRRTSYSGLIRVQEQPVGVTSEPEVVSRATTNPRWTTRAETARSTPRRAPGLPSPMAALPSGAAFGSLVHGVLEESDPEAPGPAVRAGRAHPHAAPVVAGRGRAPRSSPTPCSRRSSLRWAPPRPACAWSTSRCATGSASSTSSSR